MTDKERYDIGKYSSIHVASTADRKLKRFHPQLGESIARSLKKNYEALLTMISNKTVLPKMKNGRPLMVGSLDEKVKICLMISRRKGGVVNSVVAIADAQALIAKSTDEHLNCIDLISSAWIQSVF